MLSVRRGSILGAGAVRRLLAAPRHFSSLPVEYPPFVKHFDTLIDLQKDACTTFKDNKYLGTWKNSEFEYITYKEFGDDVDRFRTVLSQYSVKKNDKVAIISNNRVEWAVSYYAANGLGAQVVPLYEAQTERDWRFIVENSEAKLLLVATLGIYEKTKSYINEFPSLESIICFEGDTLDQPGYKTLMARVNKEEVVPTVPLLAEDLTAIMYTSGSTGSPKGVMLSHRSIIANIKGFATVWGEEVLKRASSQKSVCYLPWSHIFGLTCSLHAGLGSGASIALVPSRDAVLQSAELVKPAELSSVPLLLNKIYSGVLAKVAEESPLKQKLFHKAFEVARNRNRLVEAGLPVSSWLNFKFRLVDRIVMSKVRQKLLGGKLEFLSAGGGKASLQVLWFFEDVGVPICEGYGMTETAPVISMSTCPGFERRRLGSVGKALPGVEVQIRDPATLRPLQPGEEGEVCVRGAVLASGYYKNQKATNESFLHETNGNYMYLRTGDLGSMDRDGFLTISGRIKEQYKLQNGKFVSPAPVEDYIGRSVFISQVAVFGDHKEYNVALIVPDLAELKKWAEHRAGEGAPRFPSTSDKAGVAAFLKNEAVVSLINEELQKYAYDLKRYEYVQVWTFLMEPFSVENDMLTQKMSLKRHNITKSYIDIIEKMYLGEIGNKVIYK